MSQPQREAARFKLDRALIVEHDDLLFGGWNSTKHPNAPKRERGVLERLGAIELVLKGLSAALGFLVLHALGVPTEQVFKIVASLAH